MNKMLAVGAFMGLAGAVQGCETEVKSRNRYLEVCGEPTIERVCVEISSNSVRASGTVRETDRSANVVVNTVSKDESGRLVEADTKDSATRGVDRTTGNPRFDITHRVPHDGELSRVVVEVEKPGYCKSPRGVHFAFGVDNADAAGTVADPLPLEMCTVPAPNPTPIVEETPPPYVPECEPDPGEVCVGVRYWDRWDKIPNACVGTNATGDCVDPQATPTPDPVLTPEPGPACTPRSNGDDHYFETCIGVDGPIQDRCLSDTSRQFALCDPSVGCDYGEPVPCPENQLCLIDPNGAPRCREPEQPIPTPIPPPCSNVDLNHDGYRVFCVNADGSILTDLCRMDFRNGQQQGSIRIARCDLTLGCVYDDEPMLCDPGEGCVYGPFPRCHTPEEPTPTPNLSSCELVDFDGDRYFERCVGEHGPIDDQCDTASSYQLALCDRILGCAYDLPVACLENQLCTIDPNGAPRCYEPAQPSPSPSPSITPIPTPTPTPSATPVPTRLEECESGRRDVMFVFDRSGSMGFPTPSGSTGTTELQIAARRFVDSLSPSPDGVHIGQTSFADDGRLDLGLTHDVNAINDAIYEDVYPSGGTMMAESIGLAILELENPGNGRDRPDFGPGGSLDIMLIVTDGQATDTVDSIARATAAKNAGIEIFTVGAGQAVDERFLRQIASSPNHYYSANTADDLAETLDAIDLCQSVTPLPTQ